MISDMGGDNVASEADGAGAAVINVQAGAQPAGSKGKKRAKQLGRSARQAAKRRADESSGTGGDDE